MAEPSRIDEHVGDVLDKIGPHTYQWTGRSPDTCKVTSPDGSSVWCGLPESHPVHVNICGRCMNAVPCGCYSSEAHLGLPFPSQDSVVLDAYRNHDEVLHKRINHMRELLEELQTHNKHDYGLWTRGMRDRVQAAIDESRRP